MIRNSLFNPLQNATPFHASSYLNLIKTNKMKVLKLIILMAFFTSSISCQKNGDDVIKPTPAEPALTQYGTPFANVPDALDATIYQVNMRVFSDTRNFQGVTNRLDSIKTLGINVIYLMPIYPVGSQRSVNSPYCVRDYKSVNSEFGDLAALRKLIEEAHNRNMAVILDWVGNHTSWDNTWMSNLSWYKVDANGSVVSPNGWTDVAQLDFDNYEMRAAMIDAMKYWVYTVNNDGFRCDYSDGPPADFWKQAIDTLKNITTHKLLMLAEGTRSTNYSAGFNYNFGFNYYGRLKDIFAKGNSVQTLDIANTEESVGANANQSIVRYITNHDVNSSDGTPLELFGGKTGSMAAFVATAYMKGIPMIYNGQEVATSYRLTFPFTGTTINWSVNPDVHQEYVKILKFRNNTAAIRKGTLATYNSTDVCAFTKTLNNEVYLIIANLRNTDKTLSLPASFTGTSWTNVFDGSTLSVNGSFNVKAYSYLVLKKSGK